MTSLTLRIPKGLWADLEETIIQQDRQFLTEVARSLGLPIPDVIRRCLGTGAATAIPVLWTPFSTTEEDSDEEVTSPNATPCPWWTATGALWRPCPRARLSPTLPCLLHEGLTSSPTCRLGTDPFILALPKRWPVRFRSKLMWVDPLGLEPPLHEDGRPDMEGQFRFLTQKGCRIALFIKNETVHKPKAAL
jgi:hypothetical protein